MAAIKSLRVCDVGHRYYKSSDCPTCPECENAKSVNGFLASLSAPARRALEHAGIKSETELASHTKKEILQLHGIGPASLPILINALKKVGLDFKS